MNNLADLETLVHDHTPYVIALQETHKADVARMNRTLSGKYRWTLKIKENVYHSVGIGILSHLPFVRVGADTDLPAVAIRIKTPITATIVSIYIPCRKEPNLKSRLDNWLQTLEEPILFMGDVNGHHWDWGNQPTNRRGTEIKEVADNRNLVLLNDGSVTFTRGEQKTSVDVSFASASLVPRLLWTACEDPLGSDHHPIGIQLDEAPIEITRRPRWLYKEADWSAYQRTVDRMCNENPPDNIQELTGIIYAAAAETIPRTSPTPGKKALHWWSAETKLVTKARRKALRNMKRLPNGHPDKDEAVRLYREHRNTCRDTIRAAKRKSWESFLDGISPNESTGDLWAKVNAVNGKRRARGIALNDGDSATRDPIVVTNLLGRYFADLSGLGGYRPEFVRQHAATADSITNIQVPEDDEGMEINQPFRMDELGYALSKAKGQSAGPDEVGYPLLKKLPMGTQIRLLEGINREWTRGTFPNGWQHSLVVPIPKPDTPGHEVSHYRPISLTCCASKVMERMANRRLMEFLRDGRHLDERQYAFRAGRGTNTYFGVARQAIEDALTEGEHIEMATLDLSKAYNRAWTPGIVQQLVNWGLKGRILDFVKGFLQNRTFQVILGNHRSGVFREETGVPQGSVLAVTLFLIRMNGVFEHLPGGIRIFVYADDIVLMVVGATIRALRRKLIQAASYVARWATGAGFQLSAPKSGFIHLCHQQHQVSNTPLMINGEQVPKRRTLKILGVTFDRSISFIPHFDAVRKGCESRLNLLKTLAGRHVNANRDTRVQVGKAIINSRLTYGIEITAMRLDNLQAKLAPTYQRSIRITSGLLPSTPGIAACTEAGLPPFEKYITLTIVHRAIGFAEKTTGADRGCCLLEEASRILTNTTGQALPPVSRVHWCGARGWNLPKTRIDPTIKNQIKAGSNPTVARNVVTELLQTKYRDHCVRYSDGSRLLGRVGMGVSGPDLVTCHRLPDQCSVFSAEAAAAWLAATEPSERPVAVLTDSASVIEALRSEMPKHPWIQAIQIQAPPDTTFAWVPGHSGIRGNEEADHLAASGRRMSLFTRPVPAHDLKEWVTRLLRDKWTEEWQQTGQGTANETFLRKVKSDTGKWTDPPGHRDQRVISRLRTGHVAFAYNMGGSGGFRIQCSSCQIHNTVEHVLCHCPQYEYLREQHNIPNNIKDVLRDDPSMIATVILFLKEAGLYNQT